MREAPRAPGTLDTSGKYRRGRHYSTTRVDRVSPLPPGGNRSPMNSRFEGKIFRKERVTNDLAQILVEIESQQAIWGRQKLPVGKICLVTYGGGEGNR